jgi:hypothetical protein
LMEEEGSALSSKALDNPVDMLSKRMLKEKVGKATGLA